MTFVQVPYALRGASSVCCSEPMFMIDSTRCTGALDINEGFRGGGRSIEFLGPINKASIREVPQVYSVVHASTSTMRE